MSPETLCRAALTAKGRVRLAEWARGSLTSPAAALFVPYTDDMETPDLAVVVPGPGGCFDWPRIDYDVAGQFALPGVVPALAFRFAAPDGEHDFAALLLETGQVLTQCGSWAMGVGELEESRREGVPLKVFANPAAWFLAVGPHPATCILDWARARHELAGVPLIASSVEAGRLIRARLTLEPQIFVSAAA